MTNVYQTFRYVVMTMGFLMSKARMIFKTSWSSKSTAQVVASHKQFVLVGIDLPFSMGVLCLARCKLKKLAIFRRSVMSWSFTSGGIKGIYLTTVKGFQNSPVYYCTCCRVVSTLT